MSKTHHVRFWEEMREQARINDASAKTSVVRSSRRQMREHETIDDLMVIPQASDEINATVLTGDWTTDRAAARAGGFSCLNDLAKAIRRGDHPAIR